MIELLEKAGCANGEREIILTGDLIHRGPKSRACYEFFREKKWRTVLGNHELEHILISKGLRKISPRTQTLKEEFGDKLYQEFLQDIAQWPLFIDDEDFLLVHAGLPPGTSHLECDANTITSLRKTPDPNDSGSMKPWFDFYTGDKLVLFGHWSTLGSVVKDKVIGLDMGCVYGRKLRGLLMPERKIIEVHAIRQYLNPFT